MTAKSPSRPRATPRRKPTPRPPSLLDTARTVAAKHRVPPLYGRVAEAETMGRAAGAYYRAMIENGIPKEVAMHMVRDWAVGGPAAPGLPWLLPGAS